MSQLSRKTTSEGLLIAKKMERICSTILLDWASATPVSKSKYDPQPQKGSVFASCFIYWKKYCTIKSFQYRKSATGNTTGIRIVTSVVSTVILLNWRNAVSCAKKLWCCDVHDILMWRGDIGGDEIRRTCWVSCNSENW